MKKPEEKNCREALERLYERYEDFSVSGETDFFEMHLASCRTCRERAEEFRDTMDLLNMTSLYPVPEGFHASLKTCLDGVDIEQDVCGQGAQPSDYDSVVTDRVDSEEKILWERQPQPAAESFSGTSKYRRVGVSVLLLLVGAIAALAVAWAAGFLVVSNEKGEKNDDRSFLLDSSVPTTHKENVAGDEAAIITGNGELFFHLSREVLRWGEIKARGVLEMIQSPVDNFKKMEKEKLQNNLAHRYHQPGEVKHSHGEMAERTTADNKAAGSSKRLTGDDNKISREVRLNDKDKKELRKLLKKKRQKNRARLDERLQKSLRRRETRRAFDEKDGHRLHGHGHKRSGPQGRRD